VANAVQTVERAVAACLADENHNSLGAAVAALHEATYTIAVNAARNVFLPLPPVRPHFSAPRASAGGRGVTAFVAATALAAPTGHALSGGGGGGSGAGAGGGSAWGRQ